MRIIPVLDIKGGLVVRGVMGDRQAYRPIETPLSDSADPVAVATGLARLGDFPAFYVADLDAIEGRPPNAAVLSALGEAFPDTEFWVDAGLRTAADAERLQRAPRQHAVMGTESIADAAVLAALTRPKRVILSLDFRGDAFLGPPEILQDATLWPDRVIVMTLARVGSGAGPDLDRLGAIVARAEGRAVYAAGGVRGPEDIEALEQAGIAGALIATALHDGRLSPEALRRFCR